MKDFIDRVKTEAKGKKVFSSITPGQQFIKLLKDQLTHFLGQKTESICVSNKGPTIILVAGLQGSGKTTTCVKLPRFLNINNKKKPCLILLSTL